MTGSRHAPRQLLLAATGPTPALERGTGYAVPWRDAARLRDCARRGIVVGHDVPKRQDQQTCNLASNRRAWDGFPGPVPRSGAVCGDSHAAVRRRADHVVVAICHSSLRGLRDQRWS